MPVKCQGVLLNSASSKIEPRSSKILWLDNTGCSQELFYFVWDIFPIKVMVKVLQIPKFIKSVLF